MEEIEEQEEGLRKIAHHAEEDVDHVPSVLSHVLVYLALLALLVATAWVSHLDLGQLNAVVAMVIAAIKMLLVVLFFMEVLSAKPLLRIFVCVGVVWFLILVTLSLSDYVTRDWLPMPGHWPEIGRQY